MSFFAENINKEMDEVNIVHSYFAQLLNSLSGIKLISNFANQHVDRNKFIDMAMRTIIEHLDVEEASLYLIEGKSLTCVASLNWEQYKNNTSSINKNDSSFLLTVGVVGKAASDKNVIHIRNCKTSNENLIQYESKESHVGSIICSPILAQNTVLGVIEITHPDPDHFKLWQEKSIVVYSDLIGLILNNIKLLTNMDDVIQERTKDLNIALVESEKLRIRYEEMSVIDPLTKLYNRRYFFSEVSSALSRAKRYSQDFSLLLMDLDHFKKINDSYGHESGDNVLIEVANILNKFSREGDTLARIGGEEFVLALPLTDTQGAVSLAERIRSTIQDHKWRGQGNTLNLTISIGVATLKDCTQDYADEDEVQVSDILRKADIALYYVKQNGRNNVKSFPEVH